MFGREQISTPREECPHCGASSTYIGPARYAPSESWLPRHIAAEHAGQHIEITIDGHKWVCPAAEVITPLDASPKAAQQGIYTLTFRAIRDDQGIHTYEHITTQEDQ